MNEAEVLLHQLFKVDDGPRDLFVVAGQGRPDMFAHIHPDARYSMFGPSGIKETLVGREAFIAFVTRCADALSGRADEIIAISGIDEHCALVHAASGEEIRYEWAMLYRVEDGRITYGTDMLDPDAQAFWGRIFSTGEPSA